MNNTYNWFIIKCPCGTEQNFITELTLNLTKLKAEKDLKEYFIPNLVKPKGKITMGSYVFIKAINSDNLNKALTRINFASFLLDSNTNPVVITEAEIIKMKATQEKEEQEKEEQNQLKEGQKIIIKEGPFKDFEGIIEKIDLKTNLISVLVFVLGNQLEVKDLPLSSVDVINIESN